MSWCQITWKGNNSATELLTKDSLQKYLALKERNFHAIFKKNYFPKTFSFTAFDWIRNLTVQRRYAIDLQIGKERKKNPNKYSQCFQENQLDMEIENHSKIHERIF